MFNTYITYMGPPGHCKTAEFKLHYYVSPVLPMGANQTDQEQQSDSRDRRTHPLQELQINRNTVDGRNPALRGMCKPCD